MGKKGKSQEKKRVFICKIHEWVTLNQVNNEMICMACGKLRMKHEIDKEELEKTRGFIERRDKLARQGKEITAHSFHTRKRLGMLVGRR